MMSSTLFSLVLVISIKFVVLEPIPCRVDFDCTDFENATCTNSFCLCPQGTCEDNEISIVVNSLEHPCKNSKDCIISNSECRNKKCACKNNTAASLNGRKCLKLSSLGDFCDESAQCQWKTPLAGCQENKCVCQQQMHEFNGSCFKNVGLHGHCLHDNECTANFSKCVKNRCECIQNYISNSTSCVPIAQGLNSQCTYQIQCQGKLGKGANCLNSTCKCEELLHYNFKTEKCVENLLLGEICSNHSDCHQPGDGHSRLECILGQCKCRSFYIEEDGYCISSAKIIIKLTPIYLLQILFYFLLK